MWMVSEKSIVEKWLCVVLTVELNASSHRSGRILIMMTLWSPAPDHNNPGCQHWSQSSLKYQYFVQPLRPLVQENKNLWPLYFLATTTEIEFVQSLWFKVPVWSLQWMSWVLKLIKFLNIHSSTPNLEWRQKM